MAPEIVAIVHELYAAGRVRWARLPVLAAAEFAAHVVPRLAGCGDPVAYLRGLVAEDLYLACACACGVPGAVAAFDAAYLSRVPDYVRRIDPSPRFAEEIQQVLRERLLVRRSDAPARIAEYAGRGALASWLRIAAVRVAIDHRARQRADQPRPSTRRRAPADPLGDGQASDGGSELAVLRARYADALTESIQRAVAALAPEQRVILRMYFAAELTTQQIAAVLGVNRSTAARRLIAARKAVFDHTHRLVRARFAIDTRELASLAGALRDHIHISIDGLLADPPPEPASDRIGHCAPVVVGCR